MGTSSGSRLTPHHHWPWKRTLQILVQCAGGDNEDAHYQRYYKTMPSGLDFPCQAKSIWRRSVLLLLTEAVGWASVPEWCRRRCSGSYFDGVLLRMIFTPHLSSGLSSDLILDLPTTAIQSTSEGHLTFVSRRPFYSFRKPCATLYTTFRGNHTSSVELE